jgi:hypothetical protein
LSRTIRIAESYDPVCPQRDSARQRVSSGKTRVIRSAAFVEIVVLAIACAFHSGSCCGAETPSGNEIVTAIYRQVLRRDPTPKDLEDYSDALRDGKTVKEIVKEICETSEFMQAITKVSTKEGLITCYERILGRTPTDDELRRFGELLANSDWHLVIAWLIESSEYKLWFGKLTVPFPRDRKSQPLTYKPPERFFLTNPPERFPDTKTYVGGIGDSSGIPWAESRHAFDHVLARLGRGNIAFNTPESMSYGETKTIQLLLDASKSGVELMQDLMEEGLRWHAEVRTSDEMEADLTGDAFEITRIPKTASARQALSLREVTEWRWDIRAKRFSSQRLHLSLDAIVKINGKELAPRHIRVFDKDIEVRVTDLHSAALLAEDNWQVTAAISTGILGVIGWLFKRLLTKWTHATP